MKIDLDELERVAPASGGCGPSTTLALIARIRELEGAVSEAVSSIEAKMGHCIQHASSAALVGDLRAIIEKGVVLP